jgi:glycosyltransferase involved in cell wall biosynthesis
VGIGRAAEQDLVTRFTGLPHFNIPYHCDLSGFQNIDRGQDPKQPVTFLFCGQMIWRKGVDLLLHAFDRIIRKGLDARLVLVGREAELQKYVQCISAAGRSRIFYEGFQPPERLPEYFARGDVFVLPSRYDGWGVVINQALAAGLPVISTDSAGAAVDLIQSGVNGIVLKAGEIDSLESAMEGFARNPSLARQFGQNSRKVAAGLTPEAGAEKWVKVFEIVNSL